MAPLLRLGVAPGRRLGVASRRRLDRLHRIGPGAFPRQGQPRGAQRALDQPIGDELRGSRAGAAAGQALADGLRGCVKAHASLDLYDLNLTDAGALPILHSLAEWPGCASLDLGSNRLGFSSATALGPLLLLEPPPGADDLFRLPDETEEEAAKRRWLEARER